MLNIRRFLPAFFVLGCLAAPVVRAQIPGAEITAARVTRAGLDSVLVQLDRTANSGAFSGEVRARARQQAAMVRQRLADGDFQIGDRVLLNVDNETTLTDTFVVEPGRVLQLPRIGPVSVQGVLRSELADHLTRHLQQFLRDPRVRAQALIRVTVSGAVGRQGFYTVPVDIPVSEVFTAAGGLAQNANIERMKIRRGTETMWLGPEVLQIITEGRTIDALNIQAGDQFDVEAISVRNPLAFMQTVQLLLAVPFTIVGLINLINN